jgi:cytochrome c oxidase assembly factor CtaG
MSQGLIAHVIGTGPDPSPGWPLQPLLVALLIAFAAGWAVVVWRIDRMHPATPVPPLRTVAFLAALATLFVALQSPIDAWADDRFSVHMVQHILLMFVAAPLFVLAAPITQLLRLSRPGLRRRVLIPLLHGRVARGVTFPIVTWLVGVGVMWVVHFSALFERALESESVHDLEHVLLLGSAMLFWLPVVGSEPVPWRLGWSGRFGYLALSMPFGSLLGMVIVSATVVLYPHYAALGGDALQDQRLAGTIMWVGADLLSLVALAFLVRAWMIHEDRRTGREQHASFASRGATGLEDEAGNRSAGGRPL